MEGASRRSPRRARVLHLHTGRLLDDFFASGTRAPVAQPSAWEPRADVYETDAAMVIQVELCGVARDDATLSLEGRRLVLRGTRCAALHDPQIRYRQMEIPCGPFERVFDLPPHVSSDRIEAKLKDGLLTVTLPRTS